QAHAQATFTKLVRKEDGLLDLSENAETNLRKVVAYSVWPGAHMIYKNKRGQEIRVVVKDAKVEGGVFVPTRVIPAGKKEMDWQSFLNGQNNLSATLERFGYASALTSQTSSIAV